MIANTVFDIEGISLAYKTYHPIATKEGDKGILGGNYNTGLFVSEDAVVSKMELALSFSDEYIGDL